MHHLAVAAAIWLRGIGGRSTLPHARNAIWGLQIANKLIFIEKSDEIIIYLNFEVFYFENEIQTCFFLGYTSFDFY